MGCGCGGSRNVTPKPARSIVAPAGVVSSAKIPNASEKILQEKKILEAKRREKLIRALKIP